MTCQTTRPGYPSQSITAKPPDTVYFRPSSSTCGTGGPHPPVAEAARSGPMLGHLVHHPCIGLFEEAKKSVSHQKWAIWNLHQIWWLARMAISRCPREGFGGIAPPDWPNVERFAQPSVTRSAGFMEGLKARPGFSPGLNPAILHNSEEIGLPPGEITSGLARDFGL